MLFEQIRQAVMAAPHDRLPELSAALWKAFGAGAVTEAQAEELSLAIEARKAVGATQSPAGGFQRGRATFPTRKLQRPPVRSVAIERRRRWAAAGRMPPKIASPLHARGAGRPGRGRGRGREAEHLHAGGRRHRGSGWRQ